MYLFDKKPYLNSYNNTNYPIIILRIYPIKL